MDRHGIAWRNYYSSLPTTGAYLPVLQANGDKVVKIDRFFSDAMGPVDGGLRGAVICP